MSTTLQRYALLLVACGLWTHAALLRAEDALAPNALLSVDQNRATIVDRIMADWAEALAKAEGGLQPQQLRLLLEGMRADHLLGASLAGTLEGLRSAIVTSLGTKATAGDKAALLPKALGDILQDIVYTPVTPCRLIETRGTFPAVYQGDGTPAHTAVPFATNETRNYSVQGGNGQCLTQLPAGLNPSAVQLQIFGIHTTSVSGDIEILPQGSSFGSTATLVYLATLPFTSGATTARINTSNNQIGIQVRGGGAHLAIDVVGYFTPPVATALQCTQVASASTPIAVSSDTLVALPACASGYMRTAGNCSGTNGIPGGYLLENNASGCLFRNLSAVAPYNATATSTCCRVPGK